MQSRTARVATVAATIVAAVIVGLVLLVETPGGRGQAWAIDQTAKAIDRVDTCVISGQAAPGGTFKLWLKREGADRFKIRYESANSIAVVNGASFREYVPFAGEVYVSRSRYFRTELWQHVMDFERWLAGKKIQELKDEAAEWQQMAGSEEASGRPCVLVTCRLRDEPQSYWIEFDPRTKLAVAFKQWLNPDRTGQPLYWAQEIEFVMVIAQV
jgi:hypothetical protein